MFTYTVGLPNLPRTTDANKLNRTVSGSLTVQPVHDSETQLPQKSTCLTLQCIQHISQYRHLVESAYREQ